jgi:hypothetical protein
MKTALLVIALAAVVVVAFGQVVTHGVTLSCTGVAGATFTFYRTTTAGTEAKPPLATGLATCQYEDTTAVVGTKYFYTATQTVGGVESGPSSEVSAQIIVPPNPTNPATATH